MPLAVFWGIIAAEDIIRGNSRVPYQTRQNFRGQNCRKSDLLPNNLSAKKFFRRKFCPPNNFV